MGSRDGCGGMLSLVHHVFFHPRELAGWLSAAIAFLGLAIFVSVPLRAASSWHRYGADLHVGAPILRAASDGGYLTLDAQRTDAPAGQANTKRQTRQPVLDFYNPGAQFLCHNGGPWRARVMKVDGTGALLWAYQYQVGVGCTVPRDLAATRDGGAVFVAGTPASSDTGGEVPVVVRLDRFGKIVWQVAFQSSRLVWLTAIAVRTDGTILVAGAAYGADKNVISLDDGGRILSVDSLSGDFDSIEAIVALDDGYAAALGWETYPQYEVMLDRVPAVVRVRGGNVLWSMKLPTVPALVNFVYDVPIALVPAPGNAVVVQSATGRDAMLDGAGQVLWSHYVGNHVSEAPLRFGTVDDFGTFWRPFGPSVDPSVDATRALHRVALNGSVSDVVLGSSQAAPLALARSTNGIIGVLAADADSDLNDATSILAYDAFAPGCLAPSAPSDSLVYTDLGTAEEAAAVGIGSGSVTTTSISAVRYCLGVTDTLVCGANTARAAAAGEACGGPLLTFEFTDEQKVLISKYGPEDYLSRYQTLLAGDQSTQSPDRHIEVRVRVTREGVPAAGVNVYFRVTDPPDTAAYTVAAHDAKRDDNDPAGPKGALIVPNTCTSAPSGAPPCTTSGSDGWARVILTVTDHAAGDNYFVEGSTDPAFPCGSGCSHSGLITAWKRIYVEADTMFRSGAYVGRTVTAGDSEVVIALPKQATGPGIQPFREGQHVLFIHGEKYMHGQSAGQKLNPTAYAEEADIARATKADPRPGVGKNAQGAWVLRLAKPLSNRFSESEYAAYPFLADAVGIITGSAPGLAADYYVADQSLLAAHFAAMQVDVRAAPQQFSAFPFAVNFTVQEEGLMSLRWFANASRGDTVNDVMSRPNHIHLIGASFAKIAPACSTQFGDTLVQLGNNRSFVYVGRIEQASVDPNFLGLACGPAPTYRRIAQMAVQGTVTHEITHQWRANHRPGGDVDASGQYTGHCSQTLPNGDMCLMHHSYPDTGSPTQIDSGRTGMHYVAHGADSEYLDVRRVQEPIPQQFP